MSQGKFEKFTRRKHKRLKEQLQNQQQTPAKPVTKPAEIKVDTEFIIL